MNDGPYMTHDIGARNDPKLVEIEMAMKGQGKAIWWDLVEWLWEAGGYLPMDFKRLAYTMRYCTEEEVRAVVMDFGLFENDGDRFWNNSALARIQHKKDVSTSRSDARRGASRSGSATNENQLSDNCPTNENQLSANKSINKSRNKEINPPRGDARAEEERIFEILFFRNLEEPEKELARFREHYWDGERWRDPSGAEVKSLDRAAQKWVPEKTGPRFQVQGFLAWYKSLYAQMKADGYTTAVLEDLFTVAVVGKKSFSLVYSSDVVRAEVEAYVREHALESGMELKFITKP
jgi:hypothetical protein